MNSHLSALQIIQREKEEKEGGKECNRACIYIVHVQCTCTIGCQAVWLYMKTSHLCCMCMTCDTHTPGHPSTADEAWYWLIHVQLCTGLLQPKELWFSTFSCFSCTCTCELTLYRGSCQPLVLTATKQLTSPHIPPCPPDTLLIWPAMAHRAPHSGHWIPLLLTPTAPAQVATGSQQLPAPW